MKNAFIHRKKTLEDYLVEKLQEKGRTYVPGDELIRESLKEPPLKKNLAGEIKEMDMLRIRELKLTKPRSSDSLDSILPPVPKILWRNAG